MEGGAVSVSLAVQQTLRFRSIIKPISYIYPIMPEGVKIQRLGFKGRFLRFPPSIFSFARWKVF